jgi:putative cell wall binding repeat protein
MALRERPINADLPAPDAPSPPLKRRRRPIPAALKAIVALVLVAVVFLVAAILGGGSSPNTSESDSTPAPAQAPPAEVPGPEETPAAEAAGELGYPSFATNNTTRVGGSDPASTAAGVALAVFPSATATQRPAAVTLVDEADWQGAVAAAVLMAEPVRSPLLVSTGGDLPEATEQALSALAPQGNTDTGKTQAFVIGKATSPDGLTSTHLAGSAPPGLAAAIAAQRDKLFDGPPDHIVLASESHPEFAAPAAAWAARSGDPVLFSDTEKLQAATAQALKRHPKAPIYVLGPSAAISSNVVREAAKAGGRVQRVSGEEPVENAIALARYASGNFGWNVNDPGHGFVVARSDAPLEAAIASPLSASGTWGPLLLTDSADTLPAALRDYLLDVKPGYTSDPTRAFYNHVWVIGDQEAIDVKQQADINQLAELAKIGGEP